MSTPSSNPPSDLPLPFEQSLTQLQEIVSDLENGELNLEQSLQRFEEGIHLLKMCYQVLDRTEQRIELLTGFDAAGQPLTTPANGDIPVDKTENSPRKTGSRRASKSMFSDSE